MLREHLYPIAVFFVFIELMVDSYFTCSTKGAFTRIPASDHRREIRDIDPN